MKFKILLLSVFFLAGCVPREIVINQPPSAGSREVNSPHFVGRSGVVQSDPAVITIDNTSSDRLRVRFWFDKRPADVQVLEPGRSGSFQAPILGLQSIIFEGWVELPSGWSSVGRANYKILVPTSGTLYVSECAFPKLQDSCGFDARYRWDQWR